MRHTQETLVFPLLYTAACAVNSLGPVGAPVVQGAGAAGALVAGGLIPGVVLRSFEQQVATNEVAARLPLLGVTSKWAIRRVGLRESW